MADEISYSIRDVTGKTYPFTSLASLKDFLAREIEFWNKQQARFGKNSSNSNNILFLAGGQQLSGFFEIVADLYSKEKDYEPTELNDALNRASQSQNRNISQYWLSKSHPWIEPYLKCAENYDTAGAQSFFAYATGQAISNLGQKNVIAGAIAAYEFFDAPDEHLKRKTGERQSLSALRNEFSSAKDELFADVETLKEQSNHWSERAKRKQIRRYRAQKAIFQKIREDELRQFRNQKEEWDSEFKNLRKVYEDHLKLEAPAKYWSDAAKKFKIQGVIFTTILLILVFTGLISITSILELWMLKGETPLSLSSIQGIVLFGSLAAVFAYGVRVLSRMSFSSFHLMRDAEERHQLTHLYLSLINETESDERAREIILQALFSRSETGLLATENGPTMPGVRDIARGLGRSV